MNLLNIKLEFKLLLLFVFISLVPLLIDNVIWFGITKNQMATVGSSTVKEAANNAENAVNDFFRTKFIGLIIHSQTEAVRTKNAPDASIELRDYLAQDNDLEEFLILDTTGKVLVHVARTNSSHSNLLGNIQNDPAFKVPTFGGGEKYISPLYKDTSGNLLVTLSIPIVLSHNLPNLQNLNTSALGALRPSGEITGVLVMRTKLDSLWKTLQAITINNSGYIFIVDSDGRLLYHPFKKPLRTYTEIASTEEVSALVNDSVLDSNNKETVRQTINDQGTLSLSTHRHIDLTKWGIIAQDPVNDVFGSIMQVEVFGVILFLFTLLFTIILSLGLSKNIVIPIQKLGDGARNFGHGNFSYRIHIRTGDELEGLAYAFNSMAINLELAFQKLSLDKNVITAEKNKLNFVLFNITDAVIALDKQRSIVIFNSVAERMTGFLSEEVIGKPVETIFDVYEEEIALSVENYAPLHTDKTSDINDEVIFKPKVELRSKRGKKSFIKFNSVVLRHEYNHSLGYIITLHDITEELNLERMKMDFVSIAAHELRTPLTVIKGYLSVLREENEKSFTQEQNLFLTRIERGTEQLTFLVENLLNVARIEKGTMNFAFEIVDWAALAKQITVDLKNQAADKKIELTFHEPTQRMLQTKIDPMRIREVLVNLIANAITYTPKGGKIDVNLEQQGEKIITHVKDTGIGIPASALPNLFTKFYRVSNTLTAGSKGTGLGLYIAKSIVELHNGKIWVDSTPDEGSTFSFSLPIVTS